MTNKEAGYKGISTFLIDKDAQALAQALRKINLE